MKERKNKKFKKSYTILLIAFLVCLVGLKIWQYHWPEAVIELKGEKLTVLVAKTPYHWYRGLGKRETLGEYGGMLFLHPTMSEHGIVMRDMKFPIDIVWLDHGEVVDFAPNVPLEPEASEAELIRYFPRKPVNLVLELPAGWTLEHDLKIGDWMAVIEE